MCQHNFHSPQELRLETITNFRYKMDEIVNELEGK